MMKNKGKRLVVLLIAACMILSMFSGMTVSAATDAEIYATTNTIKKDDEKYYYVNASGKTDKKTGWKKVAGKYTYYVGSKGNVTVKITGGKYYKWSNGQFKKQPAKKNSTKIINGKAFYVNKNGNIEKKTGWKKVAGKYAYYVNSNGAVSHKITKGKYYKWSNGQFKKQPVRKNSTKTIQGKAFYVNKNGNIEKKTGWKKVSGKYAYYVSGNGAVSVKITKGVYQKWSNNQWKKQKLTNYVGGIITIQKKAFFVGSDKKIIRKCGWNKFALGYSAGSSPRGYTGTEGSVLYYESEKGAYKINDKGEVPKRPMKNGWNGSVFVKNGKVQIKTTVTVGGYINVFDEDGKRVTLKKSGNNIVRSDTNGPVTTKGAYKVGSGSNKQTYYVTNNGNIKKNGTVTVNGVKYTVDASGKCTKVTENGSGNSDGSGNDGEQNSGTNGNQDQQSHVCKWKLVMNSSLSPVKTNYKEHAAVTKTVNKKIRDAYDEPIYSEEPWYVCNSCSRRGIDDQACAYETYEELLEHHKANNHGGNHLIKKLLRYEHHDAVYADVKEVVEKEWSEWDQTYKCTVCGDTMTEHVVCGDTEKKQGVCAFILDKSGELVDDDVIVTANTYYGAYYDAAKDSKYTDYLQLLKDHHFIQ